MVPADNVRFRPTGKRAERDSLLFVALFKEVADMVPKFDGVFEILELARERDGFQVDSLHSCCLPGL